MASAKRCNECGNFSIDFEGWHHLNYFTGIKSNARASADLCSWKCVQAFGFAWLDGERKEAERVARFKLDRELERLR